MQCDQRYISGSGSCVSRCMRKSGATRTRQRKMQSRARGLLWPRIMRRDYDSRMMPARGTGLFKVHNRLAGSSAPRPRKSDYGNRFILTGARDPTKTRPALNPLWARIETPHLLATTDAFTATDYRSLMERKRERERERRGSSACI